MRAINFAIVALLFCMLVNPAFAQQQTAEEAIAEMTNTAKSDIEALYTQWRQANPNDDLTAIKFLNYIEQNQDRNNVDLYLVSLNSINNKYYQPLFILPNGGWLMGNFESQSDLVGFWVDINGGSAPGQCKDGVSGGQGLVDHKIMTVSTTGTVTVTD